MSSRAETVKAILVLEAFADEARRLAGEHRTRLGEEAISELGEQGTAPTWRIADIARVTLPVSKQRIDVSDLDSLRGWVEARHPEEVETITTTRVRPEFVNALLAYLVPVDDVVIDPETGEIVPGLRVRPGGLPGTLTITAERKVKVLAAVTARDMLGTAQAALVGPIVDGDSVPAQPATFSPDGDPFALFPPAEDPFATHPPMEDATP